MNSVPPSLAVRQHYQFLEIASMYNSPNIPGIPTEGNISGVVIPFDQFQSSLFLEIILGSLIDVLFISWEELMQCSID